MLISILKIFCRFKQHVGFPVEAFFYSLSNASKAMQCTATENILRTSICLWITVYFNKSEYFLCAFGHYVLYKSKKRNSVKLTYIEQNSL